MKNTYLLDVIQVLSSKEQQEFLVFLESPFFNRGSQSKEITLLFHAILAAAPNFSEINLDKNRIYQLVFRNKPHVEGKLEKLMSELNRLFRTFAVVSRLTNEEHEDQLQLEWIGWLRERGIDGRFQQAIAKYKNNIKVQKNESIAQYKALFSIAEEEHKWVGTYNRLKGDVNIPKLLHELDLYYLNYRSDLNIRLLIQQKAAKLPPESISGIFEDSNSFTSYYAEHSSLLEMTQKFLQLLRKVSPTVVDFKEMETLLHQRESHFSFTTLLQYYSHLHNFCLLLCDDGHTALLPTLHALGVTNLEKGYFFTENKIRFNAYLNLVQIALRAKELQWAMDFTEKYKDRILGGDDEQFYYHINRASCLVNAGRQEEALDLIPDTAPSAFYLLLVRRLELKAYYELKSDLLPYKMDAFRKFIERTASKSVSANLQAMNLNFVHILTQLFQSPAKDAKRSTRLTERIQGKKLICERSWLLEKAQELA